MTLTKAKKTGSLAEDLACNYLSKQGLTLVSRNYYCRLGEIDLIMRDKSYLVFIEVRYRNNSSFGSGAESVTLSKQAKLIKTAQFYLQQKKLIDKISCRFDVISVKDREKIEWIKNAF